MLKVSIETILFILIILFYFKLFLLRINISILLIILSHHPNLNQINYFEDLPFLLKTHVEK